MLSNAQDLLGGGVTQGIGRFERAIEAAQDGIAALPDSPFPYANLAIAQLFLNRFQEAEDTTRRARAHTFQSAALAVLEYNLAALKGDREEMGRIAGLTRENPAARHWIAHAEALALARSGRLQAARRSSGRAVDMAMQGGERETAATFIAARSVWEAHFGNSAEARTTASAALERSTVRDVQYAAGLALGLSGSSARSEAIAGDLEKQHPEDTFVNFTYAPVLRALAFNAKRKFSESVEQLEITRSYERAAPGLTHPYLVLGAFHSAYVRAGALAGAQRYREAAAEFQKLLDHRGLVALDPIGAMAHLQLGRVYASTGDKARAKAGYEAFFTLWKDADPGIPILIRARAEYGKL